MVVHFFEALLVIAGVVITWFGGYLAKSLFTASK